MKATHSSNADINISYNSQSEAILSPDKTQKLLPCECGCGKLAWKSLNTVTWVCGGVCVATREPSRFDSQPMPWQVITSHPKTGCFSIAYSTREEAEESAAEILREVKETTKH